MEDPLSISIKNEHLHSQEGHHPKVVEHVGDIVRAEQLLELLALALLVQPLQHHTHVHPLQDGGDGPCVQLMTIYVATWNLPGSPSSLFGWSRKKPTP